MPRFIFISGCLDGEHEFEVHRDGCKDVNIKLRDLGASSYTVEAPSAEEAVAQEAREYLENDQDWYAERDFRILPCCDRSSS